MRKKSLETSNMKQPKIETEKNIEFLKEEIKNLLFMQRIVMIIRNFV